MKSFKEREEELGILDLKKRNLFIIPGIKSDYIGKIKMGLFLEEDIELWLMDIKRALDFYLKDENNIELLDVILLNNVN